MSANTAPIFALTPNISGVVVGGTANTRSDGVGTIGTDIFKVFTAGLNGSQVERIRFNPMASAAATNTVSTVHRVYISNKTSGSTTAADTWLFCEFGAAQQTADQSTIATLPLETIMNIYLPASYTILVSTHIVNNANTSWNATVFGGDY